MKRLLKWGLLIFVVLPIGALFLMGGVAYLIGGKDAFKPSTTPTPTASQTVAKVAITATPTPTKQPTPTPAKTIKYDVLQQWEINNGGYGKVILIPTDYLNEADMTVLGQKLNNDTKNDKNAFIMVFTDKKAAALRDKLATGLNQSEQTFYDQHYVGQYTKNGNSGLHTFVIYFDGVSGKNNKTINY